MAWPVICSTMPSTVVYFLVTQQMCDSFLHQTWVNTVIVNYTLLSLKIKKKQYFISILSPPQICQIYSKHHSTSWKSVTNCRDNEVIKKVCKSVIFLKFICQLMYLSAYIYLFNIYKFDYNVLSHSASV